jgi:hypothetical protein
MEVRDHEQSLSTGMLLKLEQSDQKQDEFSPLPGLLRGWQLLCSWPNREARVRSAD